MKRKVGEKFEVGKANMEFPDYEIKIEGQTPITYADAINKRIKNITQIKKDFERKDEIMDEFENENQKRFDESMDDVDDIDNEFERIDRSGTDEEVALAAIMYNLGLTKMSEAREILPTLSKDKINDYMEYYFLRDLPRDERLAIWNNRKNTSSSSNVKESFDKELVDKFMEYHEYPGNYDDNMEAFDKVYDMLDTYAKEDENPDNMTVDELFVRAPRSEQEKMIKLIKPNIKEALYTDTKLYKEAVNISEMLSNFISELGKINTSDFMVESDFEILNRATEVLDGFATSYSYIMDNENVFESKKCPDCGKEVCTCDKTSENLEEAGRATAELRKPRSVIKKEDKLYSRDDVWAKVYDELSSEVENEGPKGEIYKEVDIPRGKRFIGPYVGPGNDDLTVYAHIKDDLKWAKKIADHFELKIDMKEDKNKTTNKYYPFYAILRNVSDAKVSDKEMEEYMSDID